MGASLFLWPCEEPQIAIQPLSSDLPRRSPSRADNAKGIILMLASMFVFSAVDTQAKFLTATIDPLQVVWMRQMGLFIGVVILLLWRGSVVLKTARIGLQLGRGACAALSASLFIIGVSYVPLADAVAVTFIAPLLVTIMGAVLLGEYVGIHRWTAVLAGFAGTLVIIRPGFDSFHPALILPLIAACLFAGRQVISRFLSGVDNTQTTVAYTAIASTLILSLPIPFVWSYPQTQTEIFIIISMASMAALGELLVIKALEVALAVVVSPMQYTIIIWSSFYGFMVFDQLPDGYTVGGTAIIILSGLYTLHRERLRSQEKAAS